MRNCYNYYHYSIYVVLPVVYRMLTKISQKMSPHKKRAVKLLPFQIYLYQNFHLDDVVFYITFKKSWLFQYLLTIDNIDTIRQTIKRGYLMTHLSTTQVIDIERFCDGRPLIKAYHLVVISIK